MLNRVNVIDVQRAQFRYVASHQLHHLRSRAVRHAVVSLVAVGERILEGSDDVGFGSLGLLYLRRRTFLAEHGGTKVILRIGDMSEDLAVAAHGISRLKAV